MTVEMVLVAGMIVNRITGEVAVTVVIMAAAEIAMEAEIMITGAVSMIVVSAIRAVIDMSVEGLTMVVEIIVMIVAQTQPLKISSSWKGFSQLYS